jgi:hypothetical protein
MGFGLMDPKMKQKYERVLEAVAFSIEAAVTGNVSAFRDARHADADSTGFSESGPSGGSSVPVSVSDELEKLIGLHERGVLSEEGF